MSSPRRNCGIQKTDSRLSHWAFTLVFVLVALCVLGSGSFAHAQSTSPAPGGWWSQIVTQVQAVIEVAVRNSRTTFSAAVLDIFNPNQSDDPLDTLALTTVEEAVVLLPRSNPAGGSIVFNTPVLIDNTFTVTGALSASSSQFQSLTALTADVTNLTAAQATLADLEVQNNATIDSLQVANEATLSALAVAELARLARLEVSGSASLSNMTVRGTSTFEDTLEARGGITTSGANIDLGDGELYAANVVNEVVAGDNVLVSGTQNRPVISVATDDLVGVLSLNEETGDIALEEGSDIRINGLEIANRSTLFSVTNRGGCVNCIDDQDVVDALTISGGSINNTGIGMSSAAQATFTTTTVTNLLTVSTTATSTFAGSINLTGGCFAVNGSCISGATPATYIGLTDTPGSLLAGGLQFASTSGTALTQSSNLTFDGSNLSLGAMNGVAIDGTRVLSADVGGGGLFLGEAAGLNNQGVELLIAGGYAGEFNTGDFATLLGYGSGGNNSGDYSTSIGYQSGYNISGNENIAIGYMAASDLAGSYNLALGSSAGLQQTGGYNEMIGYEAGHNVRGSSSVLLGSQALRGSGSDAFTATRNVAIGYQAGYVAESGADNNLLLGYRAGSNLTTGSQNIVIGYNVAVPGGGALSNRLTIGNLIYGTGLDGVGTSTASGRIGIGTSTPSSRLTVAGDIYVTGAWRDGANTSGADGDLLVSTGTSTTWVDPTGFGLGDGTYTGLTDTPANYLPNAIAYATSAANALTQTSDFVYTGSRLGVGTDSPISTVTVRGDISALDRAAVRLYDSSNAGYVGFRASTSLSTSTIWTLPEADGNTDELLVTDGAGNLRFRDLSAIGGGATTYLELTDTPSAFAPYSVPFVNATGTTLSQSSNFVFRNDRLGLGVTNPNSKLVVQGDVRFQISDSQPGMSYLAANNRFGFGTNNPSDLMTVQGGSFIQRGGTNDNRYSPVSKAGINLGASTNDVAIMGEYAFAVSGSSGDEFHVIDVRNPLNPVEVASLPLPAGATAVAVAGRYAYVTTDVSGHDFHIIDIRNPLDPVEVASVNLDSGARTVALQGRYAYVGTDNVGNDFHVIDISDPTVPFEADSIDMADSVNGIVVAGQFVYVVTSVQDNDFHVIDISDPTAVVELDSINLPSTANAVDVVGRFAYVVTNSDGDDFHVIDVSNPAAVVEAGSVDLDIAGNDVAVTGRYAYVVNQVLGNDLYVIDLLNPNEPTIMGEVNYALGDVSSVAVEGRYAYIGSANSGDTFSVIDISGAEVQSLVAQTLSAGEFNVRGDALVAGTLTGGLGIRAGVEGVQTDGALSVLGSSTSYIAGRLGVGTTTPSSQLTVAGTIKATNLEGGAVGLETDANGNIIRAVSDARLKANVTDIEGALEQVLALRGVRYEWINTERFGTQTEIGFLAQEVDQVVPEVVRKGGEYWSLNTRNLVAVVVEAIQELWEVVQGNQAELDELRSRIEYLEETQDDMSMDAGQVMDVTTSDETGSSNSVGTTGSSTSSASTTEELATPDTTETATTSSSTERTVSGDTVNVLGSSSDTATTTATATTNASNQVDEGSKKELPSSDDESSNQVDSDTTQDTTTSDEIDDVQAPSGEQKKPTSTTEVTQ